MSGHITRMSRGSRVGSSASSPSSTSRSTSTWRAGPWHACTCTLRSSASSTRPAGSTWRWPRCRPGASEQRDSRRSSLSRSSGTVARQARPSALHQQRALQLAHVASERREQRVAGLQVGGVVAARHGPASPVSDRQSASEGCGSHTCTSRCSPSAASSSTSVTAIRVWPNSESRAGRSTACGPARSSSSTRAWRTTGLGAPTAATSRRQSSGCQSRSGSSRRTRAVAVDARLPVRQEPRPLHGVGREQPGQPPGDRVAAAAPELALLAGLPVAEVRAERAAPLLARAGVDHPEQRPDQRVGRPRVVVTPVMMEPRDLGDQRPRRAERDAGAHAVVGVAAARAGGRAAGSASARRRAPAPARAPARTGRPAASRAACQAPRRAGRRGVRGAAGGSRQRLITGELMWTDPIGRRRQVSGSFLVPRVSPGRPAPGSPAAAPVR